MHIMSACHLPVAVSGAKVPHAQIGHMLFDMSTRIFVVLNCCNLTALAFAASSARHLLLKIHAICKHACPQDNIKTVNALQSPQSDKRQATRNACVVSP
jgi:hypothetical protein